MKKELLNELEYLEQKYETNFWRSERLNRRFNEQFIHFIDKYINLNISIIGISNVLFEDGVLYYVINCDKNTTMRELWTKGQECTQLAKFIITKEGDYILDCITCRYVNVDNYNNYFIINDILKNLTTFVNCHSEYIKSEFLKRRNKYDNIINILELPKLKSRIDEIKATLKEMEEDLLLEVGNVYVDNNGIIRKIINRDNDYVLIEKDLKKIKFEKNTILKNIKEKIYVPDKVTERKIKLKRLLYEI